MNNVVGSHALTAITAVHIGGKMDDLCFCCQVVLCRHGHYLVSNGKATCRHCNQDLAMYCLPTHEGKVDFNSDVYSSVCRRCHDIHY